MLVLGIDPGMAATGYGLVREKGDGSLVPLDFGVIRTSSDVPMPDRLLHLFHELLEIVSQHHPDHAAVEKLYFQRNVRTAMSVGQARGVALLALAHSEVSISEYTPLEIKQSVTGYGNAEKMQIQQMVRSLLSMDDIPRPDDAADALAVAICHAHSYRMKSLEE